MKKPLTAPAHELKTENRKPRTENQEPKTVLILGLAREGVSLARYFAGRDARVTVTDSAPEERLGKSIRALGDASVRLELGAHHPELVDQADAFFVSPGVPETNPVYRAAVSARLPVQSMTTLFFDRCPGIIVGITGSSGKTTTTGLIGHILRRCGRDVAVGGNIGDPMLDLLPRIGPDTIAVLELSSFQLSLVRRSPHIAVVTNISPNHLDRHGTMEDYILAKRHIVEHQKPDDYAVLNAQDGEAGTFEWATSGQVHWFGLGADVSRGAAVRNGWVGIVRDGGFVPVMACADIPLLGRHNVENVLAALAAADILRVDPERMAGGVRTFRPAPHRLQLVGERNGVCYVNDSIATSPARALVALQAFDAPILLIAGGRDKNLPWQEFAAAVVQKARALYLIGEAASLIERAVRAELAQGLSAASGLARLRPEAIFPCASLAEAVAAAGALALPGEVVLLSPGCASYDMFADFEERGARFARAVEALDAA